MNNDRAFLGPTEIEVSRLCLGTMDLGSRVTRECSFQILDRFVGLGGTFLDTANSYAFWHPHSRGGESESTIGEWLTLRRCRQRTVVASKVGFAYQLVPRSLSRAIVLAECDKSLRRLCTDYLDLYYVHIDDDTTPLAETMETLSFLVRSGRVRAIGASNFPTRRFIAAQDLAMHTGMSPFCCIQQRHTYLPLTPGARLPFTQVSLTPDLMTYCARRGCALLGYSTMLSGAYSRSDVGIPGEYKNDLTAWRLEVLSEVAAEAGATRNQVILAWMLGSTPEVLPVVGVSNRSQLDEHFGAFSVALAPEHLARLDNARSRGGVHAED